MKPQKLKFVSRLENIAPGMNYFAVSVPLKITEKLGTRGPVPVYTRVNGSEPLLNSLYPVGGGRHYLRIKSKTCFAVKIKTGDRVRVEITVRDRSAEVSIPKDVASALRAAGVLADFKKLPIGKRSFILRKIDEAAKPETRKKRIQDAVKSTRPRPR